MRPDAQPGGTASDRRPVVSGTLTDGVGTITLDRPDCRNAVDATTVQAMHACLRELAEDPRCRVILLRGEGPAFCSGWDLRQHDVLRDLPGRALEQVFEDARALLTDLRDASQVTIASVQGPALGFGLSVVAACDLAIAGADARFGVPEVRSGLVPTFVMLDLVEVLPAKQALDWLLTGDVRDAQAALTAGLVSRLVGGDADAEARRIATDLAARPIGQLSATVERFREASAGVTERVLAAAIRSSAAEINAGRLKLPG